MSAYLAICAIYRDEAPYLREWIAFHRLVGVERFYLYDNGSVDEPLSQLDSLMGDGSIVHHDWPRFPGWGPAYHHCIETYRDEARWMAVIDIDEFLFSPTDRPLVEVLSEYERWPGIGVNRATYGTSWHRVPPPGLVIESYTRRMSEHQPMSVKSIVDPRRALQVQNPHAFHYADGLAVDEDGLEIEGWFTDRVKFSKLRINHYWTKSEDECNRKFARIRPGIPPKPWPGKPDEQRHRLLNEVEDDVLAGYGPRVRAALDALAAAPARPPHAE